MSYSPYKFSPTVARRVVSQALPDLKQFMREHNATHVMVTGSSGSCLLTLLALHDIPAIYVRKEAEVADSHGDEVEYQATLPSDLRAVFLDDFVSSGATLDRVIRTMSDRAEWRGTSFRLAGIYTLRHIEGVAYTNARKVKGVTVPHREWGY